jgi:hypothetical protein
MNTFERLLDRLKNTNWGVQAQDYLPTALEMEGVVRYLGCVAQLARNSSEKETPHVLASPARLLGFVPAQDTARVIEDQSAKIPDAYARGFAKNSMEWAALTSTGMLPANFSPDLFEPLLVLLEKGCRIRLSKGFLEVGDKTIPLHKWPAVPLG